MSDPTPIPMLLTCPIPSCGERHIDTGEFSTRPHKTHTCQKCGHHFQPALVPTTGVQFLPGCKSQERVQHRFFLREGKFIADCDGSEVSPSSYSYSDGYIISCLACLGKYKSKIPQTRKWSIGLGPTFLAPAEYREIRALPAVSVFRPGTLEVKTGGKQVKVLNIVSGDKNHFNGFSGLDEFAPCSKGQVLVVALYNASSETVKLEAEFHGTWEQSE